jgi:NAD+ synthase
MAESDLFADLLAFDAEQEIDRLSERLAAAVRTTLRRRGAVVGVSGGIDSSVVIALCVRALGADAVFAIMSPEEDSAPETLALSRLAVASVGVDSVEEDLSPVLDAFGCYRRRDEIASSVIPGYASGWKMKIVLPPILGAAGPKLRLFTLVAQSPDGEQHTARLTADAYRSLVATMNFKQRARKTLEYFHADRLGYAVAGTPNRLEYDQGFFVKNGDGAADVKPIAHLYKTQVYRLADALDLPEDIRRRVPTTDTYSLPQTQEEFYFSVPLETLDLCLFARDRGISASDVSEVAGLSDEEVERVFADIDAKRRATKYLQAPPILLS